MRLYGKVSQSEQSQKQQTGEEGGDVAPPPTPLSETDIRVSE